MPSCAIKNCGRQGLDEPAPGLELWEGKWSCTLCYCNPVRFPQRRKLKKYEQPDPVEPSALPAGKDPLKDVDLFGQEED